MKIFHITYGLKTGGIETMLVNIANEQVAMGHHVVLVVINDLIDVDLSARIDSRVDVHYLRRKVGSKNPWVIFKINYILKKSNPDIIHMHYDSISRYILMPGFKKRMCVTMHTMCETESSERLDRAGRIFAISDMVKENIMKSKGLESTTVYNGIHIEKFVPKDDFSKNGVFRIVQVGRLAHEIKGQDILIQALSMLVKQGVRNVSVTFVGEGQSEEYLRKLAADEGVSDCVEFLGNKPQAFIYDHIKDFDLFVQPSRYEGFGLTVAEAMSAQVPVLVSDNQGPMEVIDYGRLGYFFKSGDVADCAAKISELVSKPVDMNMVSSAHKYAEEHFSIYQTVRSYQKYYEEIISSSNNGK